MSARAIHDHDSRFRQSHTITFRAPSAAARFPGLQARFLVAGPSSSSREALPGKQPAPHLFGTKWFARKSYALGDIAVRFS